MTAPPNWKPAPHQLLRKRVHPGEIRIAASDLGESFAPNRAQRRDYVKHEQSRTNRLHLVGLGSWRRHKARDYESVAAQTAVQVQLSPRRERRPYMIRQAKIGRWLRRQQYRKQTLAGMIRAAAQRVMGR